MKSQIIKGIFTLIVFFSIGSLAYAQTADITEGCAPLDSVQFTPPAGYNSFFWDFGDGSTSLEKFPQNSFINPGTYSVEFKESPSGPVIGTVEIRVYERPTPQISTLTPKEGCPELTVEFINTSIIDPQIQIHNILWVFGDGNSSTGDTVTHTFTDPGSYNISLQINSPDKFCPNTGTFPAYITVFDPPTANFLTTPNPALSCDTPFTVNFTNSSTINYNPASFEWDFMGDSTSSLTNPNPITFTEFGDFPVTLKVTDDKGCMDSITKNVSIGRPTSRFFLPDTMCTGVPFTPDNQSSAGNYLWNFGTHATPYTSTEFEPEVTFNTTGFHTLTLTTTSTDGSCSDDTTVTIYVEDPNPIFVSNPTYSCDDPLIVDFTPETTQGVSYDWTFYDGTTSNTKFPKDTLNLPPDTTYTVNGHYTFSTKLTITTSAGCTADYEFIDTIHRPNALFMVDVVEGCEALAVQFSDSSTSKESIVSWTWIYDDGNQQTFNNKGPHTHTYTSAGDYYPTLIIENSAGCLDTSYAIHIQVGKLSPNKDFTADITTVCIGDSIYFENLTPESDSIDTWHFLVEDQRLGHCTDNPNPGYVYNHNTGGQDVSMIVGYNGCYDTITKTNFIQVDGPLAEFSFTQDCDAVDDVSFSSLSEDVSDISWDFGDGSPANTTNNPTHSYSASGDYQVILTANNSGNSCPAQKDTAWVHIRNLAANFTSAASVCKDVDITFEALGSVDVHTSCNRGYTWIYSDPNLRPQTTDNISEDLRFESSGTQQIGLAVEDINGCKDTVWQTITVYGIDVDFVMDDNRICIPSTVNFTNETTLDTTLNYYKWNFGTGVAQDTSRSEDASFNYTSGSGSIIVSLYAEDVVGCSGTITKTISIYKPTSSITTPPQAGFCQNEDISLTASDFTTEGSNLNFEWNFGDGSSSVTGKDQTHAYDTSGSYEVTLIFTEVATGCIDSTKRTINIQDYPTAAYSTPGSPEQVICAPKVIVPTNESTPDSMLTYFWDFGNGETSTLSNPAITITDRGEYEIKLIATTSFGCKDSVSKLYKAYSPQGIMTLNQDTICKGDSVLFEIVDSVDAEIFVWDFGDGTSEQDVSPVWHTYNYQPPSGYTVAKLVVRDSKAVCSSVDSDTIYIRQVVADFSAKYDSAQCYAPFEFTNNSINGTIYDWDFGNGESSNEFEPTHLFPPGDHIVVLRIENTGWGCKDSTSRKITIWPQPNLSIIPDTICEGDTGMLRIIGLDPLKDINISWNPSDSLSNPIDTITNAWNRITTQYVATVIDTNNCIARDTSYLYVINPIPPIVWDTTIVIGDYATLPFIYNNFFNYTWNPEDHLTCLDCSYPESNPLDSITYQLIYEDVVGCFVDTSYYTITLFEDTHIKVPTSFTPNGDGENDIIYLKGWGIEELKFWRIYNRWGEIVFETNDMDEGWNGYHKGVLQNNDIYVFEAVALNVLGEEKTLQGHINLIR